MDGEARDALAAIRCWSMYVLQCADGSLYTGITTDVERRLRQHNERRGSRFTRGRTPLALLRCWPYPDESAARTAEARFKRLARTQKLTALRRDGAP